MMGDNVTVTDSELLGDCNVGIMVTKVTEEGLIIVSCNDANEQITGYSPEELIGTCPEKTTSDNTTDTQSIRKAIRLAESGEPGIFASRFKRKDGKPFAIRCMVTGRFDENGVCTHYVFISTSINPENAGLRWFGAQGLLAQAEEVGDTGAWRFDLEKNELVCSENCYALHGLSSKTDSVERILALIPNSERGRIYKAKEECRQSGQPFELHCTYYRDDGTRRDGLLAAQPEFDDDDNVIALIGVLRDETEICSLRRKQEMFLNAAQVGFVEIDLESQTMFYSADVSVMLGAERVPDQISIEEWKTRLHPEDFDMAWDTFNKLIKSTNSFTSRYRFMTESGVYCWFETRAAARFAPGKDIPIVFGTITNIDVQVRADQELAETRDRLDLAVDSAGLGLWNWDLQAKNQDGAMSWSPHMANILGLESDEKASWQTLVSLIHPDECDDVSEIILATTEPNVGKEFRIEHRCIRPDGTIIWVENRGLARHDEKGQAIAIAGALQDITERKRAETDLVISQRRFHDVATITGECIFELDAEGYITYLSDAARQIYGYKPEELIGKHSTFLSAGPDEDKKVWVSDAHKNFGWKSVERKIIRKDGSFGWIVANGRALMDADGNIVGFRGATNDITEHKVSMEKLVESERRVSDVVRIAGGCIFDLDTEGRILYMSDNAASLFGASPADLIGKHTYALAPDLEPRHQEWLDTIRHSDGGLESEIRMTPLNGEVNRWMSTNCRMVTDDDGNLIGYRGVAFDISTRKQAEIEIINARKAAEATAEERSRFLSTMSHEIRTPLNAMIGMTDLLLDMPQEEEQGRLTNSANTAGKHLLALINDILDFSKLEANKLEVEKAPFNLQSEIRTVHDMLITGARDKGLNLKIKLDNDTKGDFVGDPSRIRQILVNLVGNAIKFTTQGSVSVKVSKTNEQRIRFSVTDTGTGIEPEALPTLFKDFAQADSSVTRTFGGTGLGLAICKRLTEVMGGDIGATSNPGKGSTFWFEIPLAKASAINLNEETQQTNEPQRDATDWHLRVLVAEDNPANQLLIKTILTRMGHEIVMTENGLEAVDAALKEPFDLILMDVQMPKLDGVSATRQLREAGCDTPIIALTAHMIAEEQSRFSAAGMDAWLSKPFDLRKLIETMQYWSDLGPQPHILEDQKTA